MSEEETPTTPPPDPEDRMSAEDQDRLAQELAEEFRKLRIEHLLIQTLVTVSSIGYRRLGLSEDTREDRDLEQSRLAIETMRALTPVLEKVVPAELIRDFNQSVANLQLAYAKAAAEQPKEEKKQEGEEEEVGEGTDGDDG